MKELHKTACWNNLSLAEKEDLEFFLKCFKNNTIRECIEKLEEKYEECEECDNKEIHDNKHNQAIEESIKTLQDLIQE